MPSATALREAVGRMRLAHCADGWLAALCLIASLAWMAPTASAQNRETREVFRFMEMHSGTRLGALGGNHVAMIDPDAGSVWANPALLSPGRSAGLSTSRLPGRVTASGVYLRDPLTLPVATLAGVRSVMYGEMERLDEDGESLGTFRSFDMEWTAAAAAPLTARWTAGVKVSALLSSYGGYRSSAMAVSAGLHWLSASGTTGAGLVLRNAGTQLSSFRGVDEPLPLRAAIGVTHKPAYFPARLMATVTDDLSGRLRPDWMAGSEFLFSDAFRFRLGYNHALNSSLRSADRLDLSGVHFGIGLRFSGYNLDISRVSWGQLGGVLQLGLERAF
jgi:hypothetical protein